MGVASADGDLARLDRRAGALQRAVDRRHAGVEQLGGLTGLPAKHLAQDQGGPLARRQVLERGHERQAHRLVGDGSLGRVGLDGGVGGDRLDPGDLGKRVEVRGLGRAGAAEVHRACAAGAAVEHVEAHVRGDPVEPRAQRGAALEAVKAPPGADHRLLHGVLGLKRRGEHPVAVPGQLGSMLFELLLGAVRRERKWWL